MSTPTLIIDGYNLLNVTGLVGFGQGTALARARRALLQFLAVTLDEATRQTTVIVFDAGEDVPRHAPRTFETSGMRVYFARDFADADEMIEGLIRENDAPRRLTVVSSDHRIQRSARRRRAEIADSQPWYRQLWRQRRASHGLPDLPVRKPAEPASQEELQAWLEFFGPDLLAETAEIQRTIRDETSAAPTTPTPEPEPDPGPTEPPLEDGLTSKDGLPIDESLRNPFPPGWEKGDFDQNSEKQKRQDGQIRKDEG